MMQNKEMKVLRRIKIQDPGQSLMRQINNKRPETFRNMVYQGLKRPKEDSKDKSHIDEYLVTFWM